ncbi:pyridoxamine 5'-phosphate oxidase family protein, partial [bacterium]|nr:pyridoxamine 5'-phosphate oxidase family protein [bacterium]
IMTFRADGEGITFCTGKIKEVYREMRRNALVEMCYFDSGSHTQLRLRGGVIELEDLDLKKAAVEKFPVLKPWIDAAGYDSMAVFRLVGGTAHVWTPQKAFEPGEPFEF